MLIGYRRGQGSIVLRVKILNSSVSTGAGLTGLVNTSTGLIISTIADTESTATAYTAAASNIETITTNGTYSAPSSGKCRFKEVDATNHKGVYEIQIADARFSVSGAKSLLVSIAGATNAAETDVVIPLRDLDPFDGVAGGLSRLDAAVSSRMATYTQPTGFLAATFPATVSSLTAAGVRTELSTELGRIDVATSTRLASSSYTAPLDAGATRSALGLASANLDTQLDALPTAAENATAVRSELTTELGRIDVAVSTRLATSGYTTPPTAGAVADAVWDEAYADHTTAGSFGKLLDILRKANYITEGSVAAGGTPTTTSFRTTLTAANDTYDNQTLLFITGTLAGQSVPILTYAQTNGQITTQDALTAAPTAADEFVILPDHVHSIPEIADGVHDEAVEGAETLRQAVRLIRAGVVGKSSGFPSGPGIFRDAADTKARITATFDADGNRTNVTTDAT